ncbi:MAG: hypothetical protein ACXWQ6_06315 [Candidatus Limnocylindrales bacterium]
MSETVLSARPQETEVRPFLLRLLESPWAPVAVGVVAFLLYLPLASQIHRGRPDFFYLADAFLHGRTWLDPAAWLGPQDIVPIGDHVYVPFGPFPALLFVPLVAVIGVGPLVPWEFVVNAALAGGCVGLAWSLLARFDSGRLGDRLWLVALFGFSTSIWSITTAGGVWHTGQLVATGALLLALLEATGRRRGLLMGLLVGAALLCRAPIALAVPFFVGVAVVGRTNGWPVRLRELRWRTALRHATLVLLGVAPSVAFLAWYNGIRFGSPFESGYGLATLTEPVLIAAREQGLFALAHLPTNLRYLLLEVPTSAPAPLFLRPDGYGFSVLLQSPGLLLGLKARWRDPFVVGAGLTALLVLVPSLLYYGGGFYQFGFRYLLDAMPFILVLVASAARTPLTWPWKVLIAVGVVVNAWGVLFS